MTINKEQSITTICLLTCFLVKHFYPLESNLSISPPFIRHHQATMYMLGVYEHYEAVYLLHVCNIAILISQTPLALDVGPLKDDNWPCACPISHNCTHDS